MHCKKCNIDFPEGLHYCKWCGEALDDHPRITSELHTCPSCAVAVQPAWTFCKACGERLHKAVREPAGSACPACGLVVEPDARTCPRCNKELAGGAANQPANQPATQIEPALADTAVMEKCPSCGEWVEAGTLYCKNCGSAVYTQPTPFGDSALLCEACQSYSPYGSRACRVCGASWTRAPKTVVDRPAFVPDQSAALKERSLAEQRAEHQPTVEHPSGANTIAFGGAEREEKPVTSRPKTSVQTSVLPGTAGSKSEQQATTSVVQMGRITGPVEESATPPEETPASHKLENIAASDDDRTAVEEPKKESSAKRFGLPESNTAGFGSEPVASPVGAEAGTEAFVSPAAKSLVPEVEQISQDDIHTREVVRPPLPVEAPPTRVQQAVPPVPATESSSAGTSVQSSVQSSDLHITREISSAAVTDLPFEQASSQPLPKKRTGVVIASAAVAVIVIVAAVVLGYWLLFSRGRVARQPAPPVAQEQPTTTPEPPPTPSKPAAPVVPEGMLVIEAGSYTIGRNGADPLEQPQHKTELAAFFIDRTEVTNAAYKKFVDATGHKPPSNWSGANFPDRRDNAPVTGITWQDAADYAAWAGKRLPSEAEWEAAARGADGRIYPWGNKWRNGLANIGLTPDKPTAEQYPSALKEVGGYPQSASPVGAMDMIGNAWEWVADEFALYPGGITTIPQDIRDKMKPGSTYRVIRGGAYDGDEHHDGTYRGLLDASQPYPKVGFRCAKDAK